MSEPDDTPPIPISPLKDERSSVIIGSLVLLILDVLVLAGIAVHTMLCRRKYGRLIEEMERADLSLPTRFFLATPAPAYAARFPRTRCAPIRKQCAHTQRQS